jgi:hypothetical protein
MCSCCYPEISPFLPVVQLCVSAQLWQALSASPSFKPRENSASRCRQKGSIADEVIELHVAVLHRTQVSPPMVELGHERQGGASCRSSPWVDAAMCSAFESGSHDRWP